MTKSIAPIPKTDVPRSSNYKIIKSRKAKDFDKILKEFNYVETAKKEDENSSKIVSPPTEKKNNQEAPVAESSNFTKNTTTYLLSKPIM